MCVRVCTCMCVHGVHAYVCNIRVCTWRRPGVSVIQDSGLCIRRDPSRRNHLSTLN